MILQRILCLCVCLALSLAGMESTANAQQSQPVEPSPQPAVVEQAVNFVLNNYLADPSILVKKTGKPLPMDGAWSVGKETPASCPKTTAPCVRVLYRAPDAGV